MKLCTSRDCYFFRDWKWLSFSHFNHFPLKNIYLKMFPSWNISNHLNQKWKCIFSSTIWFKLSAQIWHSNANFDLEMLAWKILHCKLPVGNRLKCIMVQPASYPFCNSVENLKCTFSGIVYMLKGYGLIFSEAS